MATLSSALNSGGRWVELVDKTQVLVAQIALARLRIAPGSTVQFYAARRGRISTSDDKSVLSCPEPDANDGQRLAAGELEGPRPAARSSGRPSVKARVRAQTAAPLAHSHRFANHLASASACWAAEHISAIVIAKSLGEVDGWRQLGTAATKTNTSEITPMGTMSATAGRWACG